MPSNPCKQRSSIETKEGRQPCAGHLVGQSSGYENSLSSRGLGPALFRPVWWWEKTPNFTYRILILSQAGTPESDVSIDKNAHHAASCQCSGFHCISASLLVELTSDTTFLM